MKQLDPQILLDIWQTLKEKRLAPVAVGLVVALLAMPALMLRGGGGGDGAGEPLLPLAAPAGGGGPEVEVAQEAAGGGSKLGSYKARDPFEGAPRPPKPKAPADGGAIAPGDTAGAPDGGSLFGGSKPGSGGSGASSDSGGSDGGGTPAPNSGSGDAKPPAAPPRVKRERAFFNFRLDVRFGRPGRERRFRSLSRMSFLPSQRLPVALFVGVNERRDRAVFIVQPGLNHQGHGVCIPSPSRCQFLELAVGRDHYFSANDREFRMHLIGIARVRAAADRRARKVSRRAAERRAEHEADAEPAPEEETEDEPEWQWPWLVDGVG